jgi:hypothetical protein
MVQSRVAAPPVARGTVIERPPEPVGAAAEGFAARKNRTSVSCWNLEATMDDEKSIPEKLTDAISKAAHSVKSAVSHVIDTASDAAQHAMEANAEKLAKVPAAKPDPERVAGTTNEQLYVPEASDAAVMPMPLVPAAPKPKNKRAPKTAAAKAEPNLSGRITPTYDFAPPPSKMAVPGKTKKKPAKKAIAKKAAGKPAKQAAKRSPGKKSKSSAGRKSVGKNRKALKKPGRKSKR